MKVPIPTLHLFPLLDQKLIELLRSLSPTEWQQHTRAKLWTVKDIAAHLLDGNLRTLAMSRDRYFGEAPPEQNTYPVLVKYLNQLNADWVRAAKRVSPIVLIELLESTGKAYAEHLQTLDPFGEAIFSVGWAGEERSFNWFHIAREYTEKWHHQQQIREAVNKPGIASKELYYPVLDTFVQALPHHYRDVIAPLGAGLKVNITGEAGGSWFLLRENQHWRITKESVPHHAEVILDDDTAWKLFTKGLSSAEAHHHVVLKGDAALVNPFLSLVAVMA
ncbi:maleylpyruvate isomerase N-terminal domain-containing protein [Chryseolinea lacunae]|uniref:Maleylpyruvate isomerase N-terminal domain-containing protein n=1 Tax=Chryseolinea lacunae TaxID=2801331 RepID=A0ABS1KQ47_9BACT|nr:maleylpyruvate isomerase N-terminal domain-containing protein [Chryseolinea lacunae]MBL0741327.1 maleylpyruvate isomerase N-terminal domain-containing protein [Chryseolinea lacunae]